MNDPLPDQTLIANIHSSQAWAFEALYERYAATLRRHLCGMLGNEPAAEDLLQETFLRVWTRAGQWNGQGTVRGWVFRIATHLALNHLRTRRRRPEQPLAGGGGLRGGNVFIVTPGWRYNQYRSSASPPMARSLRAGWRCTSRPSPYPWHPTRQ